ncbi:TonB-dependent receptor [Sphingomonas sp.]|uniref:TonB-dependent receptor domain-containing protein n=1 Tax=Sphingomonas sp. TaxID=28214 RepID=UPI0017BDF18C|nr:TonB-dependent receptor [Sphingomonas sp.]MBA3511924.1 TonB-dependent receptor [Sphingomonas sp.]
MKLDFRQRLLATTLLVGASMAATPAFGQEVPPPAPCDPGSPNCPPETTAPLEGTTMATQTPSAEGENVETTQDIIVTGSRIPQPNLTAASPVTVVTSQEVKLQGTTRTEDLINSLPQSFAGQGSNISNGASGTATVNLRGLGTSRTLVLINGRRQHPGSPQDPAADLNFIPAALIKRVDVLTGGASSVYGADAVAGVVNFIMDTEFRGLRIDGQASAFMHQNDGNDDILAANDARGFRYPTGQSVNGGAQDISLSFGTGFDDNRGHILAYATYRNQSPVLQSTRDYSFCALNGLTESQITTTGRRFGCSGSATSATGSFFRIQTGGAFQVQGNQFVPGITPFNFNPYNYFQRPDERYTLGGFAEYEISDVAKPYLEAMFMNDRTDAVIAPSGNFFATNTINCDNPLLSAQQLSVICQTENLVGFDPGRADNPATPVNEFRPPSPPTVFTDPLGNTFTRAAVYTARRNVEGGGRQDDLEHTSYRVVTGLRGDLDPGLAYNVYGLFGKTNMAETYRNDFSIRRIGLAQDVVTDPATGQPVCRSVLIARADPSNPAGDPNCVPYNIFTTGGVTPEALDFLQTPGLARGDVQLKTAQIDFTVLGGEYGLQSPWSDRGISANVGGGYSKHSLRFETDLAFSTGDLAGQGGPTIGVNGDFDVRELFGEIELPIVSNSFIEEFTVRAGYRKSWYHVDDNRFSTDTYKLEAELAPIRDVRLRGSYNRAVRAPNVIELFSAQSIGLGGTADPCAGDFNPATPATAPTATLAQCQLTGVTAAQFGNITENPANQYQSLFGGNPDLEPEVADSYTFGLVLQPRWIPGLAFTVDYFDIKLENAIGVIGFDTIITQCINTGDPFFCSRINRNPGNASLFIGNGFITDINTNTGGLQTKGFDFQASYARQIGRMGNLNASFVGTLLQDLDVNPTADIVYDCASYFGTQCGTPNPKWRHKFRLGFTLPNGIGLSGQWRYFSAVRNDALSEDETLSAGAPHPANNKLNKRSYFDLAMQARITDRYNFRVGANNIFDRDPPVAGQQVVPAGFGNGNTFPQVYDALGRYLFAGFTVDF